VQLEVSRDRIPTGVTVQIQVMIQAKPDELDGLGRRLRDLMAEIERFDDTDPPTDG
jgi:hypothetical protein